MKTPIKPARVNTRSGFSLIEILVVVLIISVLAAVVAVNVVKEPGRARVAAAKAQLVIFRTALQLYRMDNGRLPTQGQGLKALVERPTIAPEPKRWKKQFRKLPMDPWNEEYLYRNPGTKDPKTYEIISKGADKELNTNDDISSQELE